MSIQVTIRNVYGNQTIYPSCEKAKVFAKMLGQTTLTGDDIQYIKAIGFEIEVVAEKVVL